MNIVIMSGRLTADPEVRYTQAQAQGQTPMSVARYTLAVDRSYVRQGETTADFIRCVSFGKGAEFAEKFLKKGMKVIIEGRIQTGSYTNQKGEKVYTTDVIVERHEFASPKPQNQASAPAPAPNAGGGYAAPGGNYQTGAPNASPQGGYGPGYGTAPQPGYGAPAPNYPPAQAAPPTAPPVQATPPAQAAPTGGFTPAPNFPTQPHGGFVPAGYQTAPEQGGGFMNIPDGIEEDLPFN